jgi:hypothetical protein
MATIKNIERQVSVMGSGAKEMAREMGREVVAAAGEGLRNSMIQHVRSMARAVEREEKTFERLAGEITRNLREVADAHKISMSDLMTRYENEARSVKDQCENAITNIRATTLAEVQRMHNEHVRHLDEVSGSQIEHLESIDQTIRMSVENAYTTLAGTVTSASAELARVAAALPNISADFEDTSRSVKVASDSFVQIKTDLEKVRNELKAAVDENSRKMENSVSFIENTLKRDLENITQAGMLISRASNVIDKMENAATRKLNAADKPNKTPKLSNLPKQVHVPKQPSGSSATTSVIRPKENGNVTTNDLNSVPQQPKKRGLKNIVLGVFSKKTV